MYHIQEIFDVRHDYLNSFLVTQRKKKDEPYVYFKKKYSKRITPPKVRIWYKEY